MTLGLPLLGLLSVSGLAFSVDEDFLTMSQVVRHNGMNKYIIPLYNVLYFNSEFPGKEIKVNIAMRET
jgi:hypothetical protein